LKSLAEEEKIRREVWGLKEIPFPDVPPDDPTQVARFFVGRDEEYVRARTCLYRGENVLVRGTWGIGKTAFILDAMYRLQEEAQGLGDTILYVLIKDFRGGSVDMFYNAVHKALTHVMPESSLKKLRPKDVKLKAHVIEAKWDTEKPEKDVTDKIDSLLKQAEQKQQKLIVAVDDMDKVSHKQGSINAMLRDAMHVLRDRRCGFILTGRALTKFDDMEISQLGVVNEIIALKPLKNDELHEVAVRQLNLVRNKSRDDAFPFSDEVVTEMAKRSLGIPRVFYRICKKTLDIAVRHGYKDIGRKEFDVCYKEFQHDQSVHMPPEIKHILYHALDKKGFLVSSKEETLEEVLPLVGAATVYDLIPYLDRLTQDDLMIRTEGPEGKIKYEIAPGTEQAAEEGKKVK
jgi:Cdc6-like AAA superfamily ATPase